MTQSDYSIWIFIAQWLAIIGPLWGLMRWTISPVKENLNKLESKVDKLESKVDKLESKFEERFKEIESSISTLDKTIGALVVQLQTAVFFLSGRAAVDKLPTIFPAPADEPQPGRPDTPPQAD